MHFSVLLKYELWCFSSNSVREIKTDTNETRSRAKQRIFWTTLWDIPEKDICEITGVFYSGQSFRKQETSGSHIFPIHDSSHLWASLCATINMELNLLYYFELYYSTFNSFLMTFLKMRDEHLSHLMYLTYHAVLTTAAPLCKTWKRSKC